MSLRQHPVFQTIREAAYFGTGALPTKQDLDRLDLSAAARREVEQACQRVAEIHDTGHHSDAWSACDDAASRIIDTLPDEQRDPGYLQKPDPLADVTDPMELAARVPRMY